MPHSSSVTRQESAVTESQTQGFTPRGKYLPKFSLLVFSYLSYYLLVK